MSEYNFMYGVPVHVNRKPKKKDSYTGDLNMPKGLYDMYVMVRIVCPFIRSFVCPSVRPSVLPSVSLSVRFEIRTQERNHQSISHMQTIWLALSARSVVQI